MEKGNTVTVAVRVPCADYVHLVDALEASDHKRMSDLLRAVIHSWATEWANK